MQSMSKNGHPYRSRKAKVAKTDDVLRGQIESLDRGAIFKGDPAPPSTHGWDAFLLD